MPLPVGPGELAHLTQTDPMLEHVIRAASEPQPVRYTGPSFSWRHSLFYRIEGDKTQLVVPAALRARLLYLAHELPLAGHQAVDKIWPD